MQTRVERMELNFTRREDRGGKGFEGGERLVYGICIERGEGGRRGALQHKALPGLSSDIACAWNFNRTHTICVQVYNRRRVACHHRAERRKQINSILLGRYLPL
ncbi:hypothetical protein Trydic_g18949 [Trypoxylus dichotomus]